MTDQNDTSDASWVLDSLVGFLKGPVWTLSILNFIEQKSVIFEPEMEENDPQNDALEQEYSKIFNQYKQMVDLLIASLMDDLKISPEQFENACLEAKQNLGSRLHSVLFEQLWAAFNFRVFKRMMISRNVDLQLQALELLGQKLNVSAEALNASSFSSESQVSEEEFELMRELFKRSLGSNLSQTEKSTATKTIDDQTVPKVSSNVENKEEEIKSTNDKKLEVNDQNEAKMRPVSSRRKSSTLIDNILHNNHNDTNNNPSISDNQTDQLDNEQKMLLLMGNKDGEISKEELEKRQLYLRQQRDKLIELKRKERSKQIAKVGDEQQSTGRPKSAKALRSSLKKNFINEEDDDEIKDEEKVQSTSEENKENNNGSNYRRILHSRLNADLIGGRFNIGDVNPDVINTEPSSNQS